MINLKIKMISGKEYNVSHPTADNIEHWRRLVLMPESSQERWLEIIPGEEIQTKNIESIKFNEVTNATTR